MRFTLHCMRYVIKLVRMVKTSLASGNASHAIRSQAMPRKPKKPKANESGFVHVSVMLELDLVQAIDKEATALQAEDQYHRPFTRTETMRILLKQALAAQAEKRR